MIESGQFDWLFPGGLKNIERGLEDHPAFLLRTQKRKPFPGDLFWPRSTFEPPRNRPRFPLADRTPGRCQDRCRIIFHAACSIRLFFLSVFFCLHGFNST